MDQAKLDRAAFAVFADMYHGSCDDDPTFPKRNWDSPLTDEQRARYYEQAERLAPAFA